MKKISRIAKFLSILAILLSMQVGGTMLLRNALQGNHPGMDFDIYWTAGRAVIYERANPYSDKLALENQMRVLRRPARPDEDQMAFAYPPYSLLLVMPFAIQDFDYAQSGWTILNLILIISTSFLAFAQNTSRPADKSNDPRQGISLNILSQLFLYPFTFSLILGNFVSSMASILLMSFILLRRNNFLSLLAQVLLGIVLAWGTGKPQAVWLFILFILACAWKKKWRALIVGFFAGLAGFLAISFLLVPDWPVLWLDRLQKYTTYIGKTMIGKMQLQSFLPETLASGLAMVEFSLILCLLGILAYRWWKNKLSVFILLGWIGLATYLIHPQVVSYSQVVFLIPFIFWVLQDTTFSWRVRVGFLTGQVIASWAVFFWGLAQPNNSLFDEARLIFYVLWMIWLYFRTFFFKSSQVINGAIG